LHCIELNYLILFCTADKFDMSVDVQAAGESKFDSFLDSQDSYR